MLKKTMKALAVATFLSLICFNVSIITDENGWSVQLVKSVFADTYYCGPGVPNYPECLDDGSGGDGPVKGWKLVKQDYYQCMKYETVYFLGVAQTFKTYYNANQIVSTCVLKNAEIPAQCFFGTNKYDPTTECPNGGTRQ